jgi:hypothetical protein
MKKYVGVDVQIHVFLTSALVGGVWSASCPGRDTQGKGPPVSLDTRLGGPKNRSGRSGEEKKNLVSTGTRTPTSGLSDP